MKLLFLSQSLVDSLGSRDSIQYHRESCSRLPQESHPESETILSPPGTNDGLSDVDLHQLQRPPTLTPFLGCTGHCTPTPSRACPLHPPQPQLTALTGSMSMVPGGPGKPSAPGRPGRPGGPYRQTGKKTGQRDKRTELSSRKQASKHRAA